MPLRVLSLDGGGIRGLSSLLILKTVMAEIAQTQDVDVGSLRPCEYFDFICGTSTGGLIALLLGRLRLTVKQAIDTYLDMSEKIFSIDRSHHVPFLEQLRLSKDGKARFDEQNLVAAIKTILKRHGFEEDAQMFEPHNDEKQSCRAAVVAVIADRVNAPPSTFTTYDRRTNCKVWEAARATSAAPTFFESITIDHVRYIDAGLGYNNPGEVVLEIVQTIWPGRPIGVFLSLGTGEESRLDVSKNNSDTSWLGAKYQAKVVLAMASLASSADRVHEQLYMYFKRQTEDKVYFRFNVDQGLETVGLQEWNKFEQLAGCTQAYLLKNEISTRNVDCASLIEQFSLTAQPHEIPATAFQAVHEGDMDTDYHSMAYWYREKIVNSRYPAAVQVSKDFQDGVIGPVGNEILSLRRVCNVDVRGQAFNINPGKYRVRFVIWLWSGHAVQSTSQGLPSSYIPEDTVENTVTQRRFPRKDGGSISSNKDSGYFFPWNFTFSVGRAKNAREFMRTGMNRDKHSVIAPELLAPGYQEQVLDPGLWDPCRIPAGAS